jgi:ABC-type branched-subunit amino acid transport system substrate-binding protein
VFFLFSGFPLCCALTDRFFPSVLCQQDMSEYTCADKTTPIYKPHKPVSGVIGASFSVVSIMVANILRLFKIPQISYASTSVELSDKSRFEYFSRVVPPDNFQAQALAEIVQTLKLSYTSTVAVEGEYGEKGIASFLKAASEKQICVAVNEKILRNSKEEDFDRIIERLYSKKQARAVVMFVDEDNVKKLLRASIRANKTGHFYWIASDSWGAKSYPVRDQEFAAVNSITVLPHRKESAGKCLRSAYRLTLMFISTAFPSSTLAQASTTTFSPSNHS